MFEGKVFLSCEPQGSERINGSGGGVIMVDNLGVRSVFVPKGNHRHKNKKRLATWARNFAQTARGRVTVHTYARVNGTTTVHPASSELRQMLLDD